MQKHTLDDGKLCLKYSYKNIRTKIFIPKIIKIW